MEIGDRKFDNLQEKTEEHLKDMERAEKEGTFHLFVEPYRAEGPLDPSNSLFNSSKKNNNGSNGGGKSWKRKVVWVILTSCTLSVIYWCTNERHKKNLNEWLEANSRWIKSNLTKCKAYITHSPG